MTEIFKSNAIRATHAFVIGVGEYPHAKPGQGTNPKLRGVKDIASAADSAKLMCDWLIGNQDRLAAPLGSIQLLISDPVGGANRYVPTSAELAQPIDRADGANILLAGEAWLARLAEDPGSVALFYACGHGANHGMQPALFHSDLNRRTGGDAWSHLNVGIMAQAFRQMPNVAAAVFFVDACGEFVPIFPENSPDSRIVSPDIPQPTDRDKVWLLSAASAGLLAHEGADVDFAQREPQYAAQIEGSPVKIGRFTQTLLKGLDGASARWNGASWCVENMGLWSDLKQLHRVYFPSWKDKPFEPSQLMTPNDRVPIIKHDAPQLPVVVLTDPLERNADFDLKIGLSDKGAEPWLDGRISRSADAWLGHVTGDRTKPFYALALDGDICHSSFFKADQPQFDQRVPIP